MRKYKLASAIYSTDMKRTLLIYSIALCLFTACESDPKWSPQTLTYSESVVPSWHSADVSLSIDEQSNDLMQKVEMVYSLSEDFSAEQVTLLTRKAQGKWDARVTNLKDSSTYYFRYRFTPSYLQPTPNVASSFRTHPLPAPSVQTKSATDITATTAILNGSVQIGDSNDPITERGFYYSLLREGEFARKQVNSGSGAGDFNVKIEALRANATYYYVAYAINKHGIAYGDTLQFNTLNPYK